MSNHPQPRLLPHALNDALVENPNRIWASYAISKDVAKDGFRDVTIRQYATAIDRLSWHIEEAIGKSTKPETLLYFGLPDVRYAMVVLAAIKTGWKVLFCSHFNSLAGNLSLCERTDCNVVLHSEGVDTTVSALTQARSMKTVQAPTLESLLDDSLPAKPYPYSKSWSEGIDDPVAIGHTSGTTGLPKPVPWTQRSFSLAETHAEVPDLDGRMAYARLLLTSKRYYQTMPIFHPFGIYSAVVNPIYYGQTLVFGPVLPGPITPAVLEQMFEHADFDSMSGVPIYLEMVAKSPRILDIVEKRLKFLLFAGGALSKATGEALAARAKLHSLYGSTEVATAFGHVADPEDFEWLCLNDKESGLRWEPCEVKGVDDVFELTFVRNEYTATRQQVFWHTNCGEVFRTNDLFIKHPTKKHHWKFYSRKDDMIVTKFGWNVNPIVLEGAISQHPTVKHVVVGGTGRRNIFAIIQLVDGQTESPEKSLESIWPLVEKGNLTMDAAGQLAKERVLFGSDDKKFPLAGKGNVQRAAVLKLYEDEIEEMYRRTGDGETSNEGYALSS